MQNKPLFILDAGPLIIVCAYPRQGKQAIIGILIQYAGLIIASGVMTEAQTDPTRQDARIAARFVLNGDIQVRTVVNSSSMLDGSDLPILG